MKSFKEFLLEDEEQQTGQLTFDKINLETYINKSADKNIGPFYGGSLLYKELKDRALGDNIKTIITRIINQAADTDDNPNDITEKDLLDVLTINPEDYEAEKVEDVSKALFVIIVRLYSGALFTQGGKVSIKNMLNVRDKNYFKSVFNELIVKDNQNNQNNQNNEPYKFTETASKIFNKITADVLGSGSFQIKKIGDKIINAAKGGIDSLTKFLNGLKNQHIDSDTVENLNLANDTTNKTEREKTLGLVQAKRHREKGRGFGSELKDVPDEDENGETSGYGNKYVKLNITIPMSFGGDPQKVVEDTFETIYKKAKDKFKMLGKDAVKKLISGNASKTRKANRQNDKKWEDLDESWTNAFINAGKMNKTLLEFSVPSFAVLKHKLSSGPKLGVGGWRDDDAVSDDGNNYITNFEKNRYPKLEENFLKALEALQQEYKNKTAKTLKKLEGRITYQRKKGLELDLNSVFRTYVYKVEQLLNDANKKMVGGFLTNIVRGAKNAMIDDNEAAFDEEKESSEAVATFNKIKKRLNSENNNDDLEKIAKIVLYLTILKTSSTPAVALKSLTENGVRFPEEMFRKKGSDFVVYDLNSEIEGKVIEAQRNGEQVGLKVTKYDFRGDKILKDIKSLFSEVKYFDGLDLNANVLQLLRSYLKKDTAIKNMVEQYKKFINQAFNEIQTPVNLPTGQNNEQNNTGNNNNNNNNNQDAYSNSDDTNDYLFSVKTESFSEFYKHWKLLKEDTYGLVDYINELKELVKNDEMSAFLSKPNSNFNLKGTGIDDVALRQLLGGKIVYDFGQFWIVSKDDNLVQKINSKLGQEKPGPEIITIDLGELEQNFNNAIANPENLTQAELERLINALNNGVDQATTGEEQTSVVTSSAADSTYGDGFRKGQTKITYSPNSKLKIVKTI